MGLTVVKGNMIQDGAITDTNFTNTTITSADMVVDPRDADNLSSGSVPLAQLGNVPPIDYTGLEDDIALLGFKTAANGSLVKYNLVDQTVDAFEDASGVDAGSSTNEVRDSSGKYYSGLTIGPILNAYTSGSGNFTAPAGVTSVEVLVVAAGGGGGGHGGAGGAGGVVHHTGYTVVPASNYAYSVGTGGVGIGYTNGWGTNGGNSTFGTGTVMTAVGGGGGSGGSPSGRDGGSGGGANGGYANPSFKGDGTQADSGGGTGYGNDGGDAVRGNYFGGAGGGAGGVGGTGVANQAGHGGVGKLFSSFVAYGTTSANVASSGTDGGYFAGGGGGTGDSDATSGDAGVGGGAAGTFGPSGQGAGIPGMANTGGGAGAARDATGGTGGSGIVIVRETDSAVNMTLISTSTTAQAAPTKGDIVMTYSNAAGTALINTDVIASFSADNGSTWTVMALASQGTTGGHTILTAHDVTRTSSSGTSMRYRIQTLNQGVSKQTRIQAVSLGWS